MAILPAENGSFYVYILPAQTVEGVYPVGGDVRYLISADGQKIVSKRRMHQDIINFTIRNDSTYSLHTHILSDTPEDSDVFGGMLAGALAQNAVASTMIPHEAEAYLGVSAPAMLQKRPVDVNNPDPGGDFE